MSVLIIAKPKNFDLDQIYKSGQCFRWKKLEEGYDADYVIPLYDTVLRATDYEQTKMWINDRADGCSRFAWEHYFDLITNYLKIETEVYHTHDKYLIKCYEHSKGIRILRQDLWEVLITFIISQNNNIPRIKKSVKALCNGSHHFPTPEELLEMDLSDKGLGYRDKYIKDACKHFMNQNYVELLHNRNHEIVRDALKDIQGVGDKDAFFDDEEEAYQIMPKKSEYVNIVDNCLHLWRPHNGLELGLLTRIKPGKIIKDKEV